MIDSKTPHKDFITTLQSLGYYAVSVKDKASIGCPTVQSFQRKEDADIIHIKGTTTKRIKSPERFQKEIENKGINPEECQVGLYTINSNITVIDVDVKNHHDINFGKQFLKCLQQNFPALYENLYIEITPSGGYHVIFKTEEKDITENYIKDVANVINFRASKKEDKKYLPVIEFRTGDKLMLNVISPSDGYEIIQNSILTLPSISIKQKQEIYQFCKQFDEKEERRCSKKETKKRIKDLKLKAALQRKEKGMFSIPAILIDTFPLLSKQSKLDVSLYLDLKSRNWCSTTTSIPELIDELYDSINHIIPNQISKPQISGSLKRLSQFNLLEQRRNDIRIASFNNIIKHYKPEIETKDFNDSRNFIENEEERRIPTDFFKRFSITQRIIFQTQDSFHPIVISLFAISRRLSNCIGFELKRNRCVTNKNTNKTLEIRSLITLGKFYGRSDQESIARYFALHQRSISQLIKIGEKFNLVEKYECDGVYHEDIAKNMQGFKWKIPNTKKVWVRETNGYIFNLHSNKKCLSNKAFELFLTNYKAVSQKRNIQTSYFDVSYICEETGEWIGKRSFREIVGKNQQQMPFVEKISKNDSLGKKLKGRKVKEVMEIFSKEEFILRKLEFNDEKVFQRDQLRKKRFLEKKKKMGEEKMEEITQ